LIKNEVLTKELKVLLEETFLKHHGMYTNKGTSMFETLDSINAVAASKVFGKDRETIAGHVFHLKFYLIVAQEYLKKTRTGHADWDSSWKVKSVSEAEWTNLKNELRREYDQLIVFIDSITDWNAEDHIVGMLGILAHNAFHLGAIRELNSI